MAVTGSEVLQDAAAVVQVVCFHCVGLGLPLHELPIKTGAAPRRSVACVVKQVLQPACTAQLLSIRRLPSDTL